MIRREGNQWRCDLNDEARTVVFADAFEKLIDFIKMIRSGTMLVLSRKKGERIVFHTVGITIHVVEVRGSKVRIGVEAPAEMPVYRSEVWDAIQRNERQAIREEREVASVEDLGCVACEGDRVCPAADVDHTKYKGKICPCCANPINEGVVKRLIEGKLRHGTCPNCLELFRTRRAGSEWELYRL